MVAWGGFSRGRCGLVMDRLLEARYIRGCCSDIRHVWLSACP